MRIQHNLAAYNAHRQQAINSGKKTKSTEKLSSGYRINRAGDDAAGLSISEKMRAQIRGLNRASSNVQDAASLLDVADSALQKCHDIIGRMRELAVQSASDTNDIVIDREALNREYQALKIEIDDIASKTTFNGIKLLDGSIAKMRIAGVEMDITGVHEYGYQAPGTTVVNGINKSASVATTVLAPSITAPSGPTAPAALPTTGIAVGAPAISSSTTTSGSLSSNGASLADTLASGSAAQKGRLNNGLSVVQASGDLTVTTNGYTGYVSNTNTSNDITVTNNSGFINTNGDNTTVGTNDHTGQVRIGDNASADATVGDNVGGEIQVGTIDSLTITNNLDFYGNKSQSYDYTYYIVYSYSDGTDGRYPSSGEYYSQNDRLDTSARPQYDSGGFSDDFITSSTVVGATHITEDTTPGIHNGMAYDKITYYYTLQHPSEYDGPKTSPSESNYAYNAYWDEYQQGQIKSNARENTIDYNEGLIELTNSGVDTKTTITNNSGTLYTSNSDVEVTGINNGIINAVCDDGNAATSDDFFVATNAGTIDAKCDDFTVTNNSGTINAECDDGNAATRDVFNVTSNNGTIHATSDDFTGGTNSGYISSDCEVFSLTTNYAYGTIDADCDDFDVNTNNGTIRATSADFDVNTNNGTIHATGADFDVVTNSGTINADCDDFDVTTNNGTIRVNGDLVDVADNSSTGTIHINESDAASVGTNAGQIAASEYVKVLTVTENTHTGNTTSSSNTGSDGQNTVSTQQSIGITSSADETIITTNSGSALILRGDLTVGSNSGYIDVQPGVAIQDIGDNTGTVVLQPGVDVSAWVPVTENKGTIEVLGPLIPDPGLEITNNSGTIKVSDVTGPDSIVTVTNNTGSMEISGGRLGGTESIVVVENNSGTIRNGGTLTLDGTNTGLVDNYGIVDGNALAGSTTIRHFASNIDTSGVDFPFEAVDADNLSVKAINEALESYTYPITFTANGQDFTIYASWRLKDLNIECECDPSVDICDPTLKRTLDDFELVFDLSTAVMVASDGSTVPASSFDGGYVVFSESPDMLADKFRYSLSDLVNVNGENGSVGTKLTFHTELDLEFTKLMEENDGLFIQSGANAGDTTEIHIEKMSISELGTEGCLSCYCGTLASTDIRTQKSSEKSIYICGVASIQISQNRANIGAMKNRLEHKLKNLDSSAENLQTAESRIRDVDMAKEMTSFLSQDIISQASTRMISVSNSFPESVLQLLQNA